jgi:hypothetical protein
MKAIALAPIAWREKCYCIRYLYWWFGIHRNFIKDDISRALGVVYRRFTYRATADPVDLEISTKAVENDGESNQSRSIRAMGFIEVSAEEKHLYQGGTTLKRNMDSERR